MSLRTAQGREDLRIAIERWLDIPLTVAAFIMLALIIIDLTLPLPAGWREAIEIAGTAIWLVFLADFVVELALARGKKEFIRKNWIVAISVVLPFFRVLKVARFARPFWLARLGASVNRALNEVRQIFRGRQSLYVALVIAIITVAGAAGIYFSEREVPYSPYQTFGDAFWYAITVITTIGGENNPVTAEGRVVAFVLMLTGMSLFGYIAATIASYFIRKDAGENQPSRGLVEHEMNELLAEVRSLKARIDELNPPTESAPTKKAERRSIWERILPWR